MHDQQDNILRSINGALQSKKLYPPGHPSVIAPVRKTSQILIDVLKKESKLTIAYVEDSLVFADAPVDEAEDNFPDIINCLKGKQIEAIIFEKGINEKEVGSLIEILSDDKPLPSSDIDKLLRSKGITHITIKSITKKNILEVYNDAIEVVKNVMGEIRLGKIPRSEAVNKVTNDLKEMVFADMNAMIGLTMIKNYDDYLYNHSVNVSIIAMSLGRHMGLSEDELHALGVGALLHDVGKTGVSEDIIKKPGGLSAEEWEKVKEHPVLGSKISKRMEGISETTSKVILEHHVRYDKTGYPKVENSIHPLSIIVSVADAYDALTTLRVYQKPYQPAEALKILKGLSGKHFDPKTIDAFESMIGVYPVGTMVRLTNNEVGVVMKVSPKAFDRPIVKVLYDAEGTQLPEGKEVDLMAEDVSSLSIVAQVDPLARNMDMGAFFTAEAQKAAGQ